jgi:hypothetical protein
MADTRKAVPPSTDRPRGPEDFLALSLRSSDVEERERYARAGLAYGEAELAADTEVLLLRQLYRALIERGRLRAAADVAIRAGALGPLADVAHHDAARALFALGEEQAAVREQRLAARHAPATRRSFHLWSLATLEHFVGRPDDALRTLARAERWSTRDRALVRAHAAYVELDAGGAPEDLSRVVRALERSKSREGYGQFLLGMIAAKLGDGAKAAVHLRAFLRRNASIDAAKALTLREELRRARTELARLESA